MHVLTCSSRFWIKQPPKFGASLYIWVRPTLFLLQNPTKLRILLFLSKIAHNNVVLSTIEFSPLSCFMYGFQSCLHIILGFHEGKLHKNVIFALGILLACYEQLETMSREHKKSCKNNCKRGMTCL